MSDEVERGKDVQDKRITLPGSNDFGRAVTRIAVAQLCQSIGFESFYESALDFLVDIAIRYIRDLGKDSKFYSSLSGRTECNIFDVVHGLQDLSPFSTSNTHYPCILSSDALKELKMYVENSEEIPFAQFLPKFPVSKEPKQIPSFLQLGESPKGKHIPAWLPAFPDLHTYKKTPVWNNRVTDPRDDKIELAKQHRKAEASLLNLQQQILTYEGESTSSVLNNELENPFVTDHVHVINLPIKVQDKKNEEEEALIQTFVPAIEAMKDLECRKEKKAFVSRKWDPVIVEVKNSKRELGETLDLRIQSIVYGKKEPWFGREGLKDDKKRRVEFILRQSMENQHEFP